MSKRLRTQVRDLKISPEGKRSFGFGFRFGYWPCVKAPYIQVTALFWRADVWYGLDVVTK